MIEKVFQTHFTKAKTKLKFLKHFLNIIQCLHLILLISLETIWEVELLTIIHMVTIITSSHLQICMVDQPTWYQIRINHILQLDSLLLLILISNKTTILTLRISINSSNLFNTLTSLIQLITMLVVNQISK